MNTHEYKFKHTNTLPPLPMELKMQEAMAYGDYFLGGAMKNYHPNYFVFAIGLLFSFLAVLTIVPGLDILAWHLLHPIGFWQRIALVAGEFLTLWFRIILAFLVFGFMTGLSAVIADA